VLKDISTIYTEKIPLGSLNKSGELTIGIVLGDPSLKLIDSTGNVTIRYIIKEKVKEKVNTKQKKN
jgi:hypothetical protein